MLPGTEGGAVFWRVVGVDSDKDSVASDANSLVIEPPAAVGSPTITPTSKTSLPTLAWDNNCNKKFKVWFGNNPDFSLPGIKKKALSFNIKNPEDNGGVFTTVLTSGQWKAIRQVVGDLEGSTIYWYVESWDGVKRYSKTDVISFVLNP